MTADADPSSTLPVLVVDDDRPSREGLRDTLSHAGFAVETALDGLGAIEKVRRQPFGVAIVDLDLPPIRGIELSGWDMVRILRAYRPGLPVIVVSTEDDRSLAGRARALGVAEVLEKPIDPFEVKALVARLQGGAPEAGPGASAQPAGLHNPGPRRLTGLP